MIHLAEMLQKVKCISCHSLFDTTKKAFLQCLWLMFCLLWGALIICAMIAADLVTKWMKCVPSSKWQRGHQLMIIIWSNILIKSFDFFFGQRLMATICVFDSVSSSGRMILLWDSKFFFWNGPASTSTNHSDLSRKLSKNNQTYCLSCLNYQKSKLLRNSENTQRLPNDVFMTWNFFQVESHYTILLLNLDSFYWTFNWRDQNF